jgi:hypothetical protein
MIKVVKVYSDMNYLLAVSFLVGSKKMEVGRSDAETLTSRFPLPTFIHFSKPLY